MHLKEFLWLEKQIGKEGIIKVIDSGVRKSRCEKYELEKRFVYTKYLDTYDIYLVLAMMSNNTTFTLIEIPRYGQNGKGQEVKDTDPLIIIDHREILLTQEAEQNIMESLVNTYHKHLMDRLERESDA